jgi:hypothetical protein
MFQVWPALALVCMANVCYFLQVMANIEEMKSRRDRTMEEHEKNLLRQFRSNIIEVEDRFKKEQSKEDDVAGVPRAWIERTAQLSRDVDKHKEQVCSQELFCV